MSAFGVLYSDLMAVIPHLSTVTDLTVSTILDHHAYGASIARLLSRCSNIETLTILVKEEVCFRQVPCEYI
jgi:hypothetical protein